MPQPSSNRRNFWANFWRSLIAVLVGNAIYFLLVAPRLPQSARHRYFTVDLGLVIDFWICLVVYGLILSFGKKKR
jgi:hypothetical protein